jgi:hypothetical protein
MMSHLGMLMQKIFKFLFMISLFIYSHFTHANTFNIQAIGSLPTSVQAGQTVFATYKITSVGNFPPAQYHIILATLSHPSFVTQDTTIANACTLNPINPAGCILQLNIVGPVSGPVKVCDDLRGRPGLNCYIPANPNHFLNVLTNLAPLLTITPPVTLLGPNASQIFTIVNTSATTAALNVTMAIPANIQAQLTGSPVYAGCGVIAPLASCTATVTASAAPAAQSGIATAQGINTAAPAPTVVINTGSAPALTVSPPTTILGPNASQIFTIVNTSTTTAALAVTMTIPANVQSQLTGLPVYSGCASIAPLGSCTATITAVASPAAQSAFATVQGSNTAGPAPTVAITTGTAPALLVSPPTTILGPNGSQIFTVTNTNASVAANNVTITIPANVQTQLLGSPVYSGCGSIAPLSTCSITITAVATPTAQSGVATVQGTNTAAPPPTVTITTGAAPALTVSPSSTVLGPNASQIFTVVNTSSNINALNVTMTIPANVQGQLTSLPVYSGCALIAPLGSCTVTITAVATPNAQSGTATVQGTNTAAPAPTVAITTGAAPVLTVSPPSAILGPNASQLFTVTNTSATITALNISMVIPANVQGQLTSLPVYAGCASIGPLGTCSITITAVAAPTAQSATATVQGTNTAAPAPTVAITTGAAPIITVSPTSANISFNGTQIFTVTNTGTIPANNITMTISANVQGQLTGLPVYSAGCTSLLPAASNCTITIQAAATPSSQSGTGTVQGTNTAAPSPVVSIFILPTCMILGNTTVTNTGNSVITGSVCVAPGIAITGFPPGQTIPAGQFHTNDSIAVADHNDAATLYNVIAGLPCDTDLSGIDLGTLILPPGVYCFASSAALTGTLTLSGTVTDKWYFQIGSTITTAAASNVTLTGGAVTGNVYWQVGSSATFGTNTTFKGQVVALTSIIVGNATSNNGRLWVLNAAISLDDDAISP